MALVASKENRAELTRSFVLVIGHSLSCYAAQRPSLGASTVVLALLVSRTVGNVSFFFFFCKLHRP